MTGTAATRPRTAPCPPARGRTARAPRRAARDPGPGARALVAAHWDHFVANLVSVYNKNLGGFLSHTLYSPLDSIVLLDGRVAVASWSYLLSGFLERELTRDGIGPHGRTW